MKNVVIISGPTATGKTATGLELGERLREELGVEAEIVNFDSLLFYRELNVGTAKPTFADRQKIPHHLIDIASAKAEFNAADFTHLAKLAIDTIHARSRLPILVGGSGFYLRALIKGMYPGERTSLEIKQRLQSVYDEGGIEGIVAILQKSDPDVLAQVHPNDHYRLTRAAEHVLQNGTRFSQHRRGDGHDFSQSSHPEWRLHHIYLDIPKERHWPIICQRTQKMLDGGLLEEMKNLLSTGFSGNERPLRSIGHKEALGYLRGAPAGSEGLPKLALDISIKTRKLAKAQRTFFKKIAPKSVYCPLSQQAEIWRELVDFL